MKDEEYVDELDRALRDLLVGEAHVKSDPATGLVVDHDEDREKSSLTDSQDANTIR